MENSWSGLQMAGWLGGIWGRGRDVGGVTWGEFARLVWLVLVVQGADWAKFNGNPE